MIATEFITLFGAPSQVHSTSMQKYAACFPAPPLKTRRRPKTFWWRSENTKNHLLLSTFHSRHTALSLGVTVIGALRLIQPMSKEQIPAGENLQLL